MKKRYDVPEFMQVDLFEDVLTVSDNDNLGDDKVDDGFDKEDQLVVD